MAEEPQEEEEKKKGNTRKEAAAAVAVPGVAVAVEAINQSCCAQLVDPNPKPNNDRYQLEDRSKHALNDATCR